MLMAGGLLYVGAFFVFALSDPLFLAPQLDAAENLQLARDLSDRGLADGPLYRAMLYPLLLSLLVPAAGTPFLAIFIGLLLHLVNGLLVGLIVRKGFQLQWQALVAAVLYWIYPPLLFASMQLLDGTLATSLFLSGLACVIATRQSAQSCLLGGLLLGLAVLTRPHFLPAALAAPVVLAFAFPAARIRVASALAPIVGCLLLQGATNFLHAGEFRLLPWQGAYNLWAANKPGANGLYFRQAVDVSSRGDISNPTHAESVILYAQAHPDQEAPYSVDDMNSYWRGQFLQHLSDAPTELAGLLLFKAYAVLHSFEQYNNLSFNFHQQRIGLLRFNPLNWGLLLIAAALGGCALARRKPALAAALLLIALAYSVALLLYFASGRFRLPLVPLLLIAAAGLPLYLKEFSHSKRNYKVATLAAASALACAAFIPLGSIRSNATWIQDRLLMANANADLQRDADAARWARDVLAEQPERSEALRIYAVSYFNLQLTADPALGDFGDWNAQQELVRQTPPTDPAQDTIVGFFWWNWGRTDAATELWQAVARHQQTPLLRAVLYLSDPENPPRDEVEQSIVRLMRSEVSLQ